jgi:hypothetical protein
MNAEQRNRNQNGSGRERKEILTADFADNADIEHQEMEGAGRSRWQKNGGRKIGNSDEIIICAGRGNFGRK